MKNDPATKVFKAIDWSYPTSPNAVAAGYGRDGCWTVSRHWSHPTAFIPPAAVSSHATREEALKAARAMPEVWDPVFVHYHPEEAAA